MKKVLIVDDEPLITAKAKELLEELDLHIFVAEDGQQGLDVLDQNPDIDCVVSDIKMPVMDGIEFIKNVRSRDNDVPFIFYTGHGDDKLIMEAVKYGAFDFVGKPDFSNLIESVSTGLERGFQLKEKESLFSKDVKNLLDEYDSLKSLLDE